MHRRREEIHKKNGIRGYRYLTIGPAPRIKRRLTAGADAEAPFPAGVAIAVRAIALLNMGLGAMLL